MSKLTAENLAELFHTAYERLAPDHGYETREGTAKPWAEIPDDDSNKTLMIATCEVVLSTLKTNPPPGVAKSLSVGGRDQVALALIFLKDWKSEGKLDVETITSILGLADHLGVRAEYDKLISKIPPMQIIERP